MKFIFQCPQIKFCLEKSHSFYGDTVYGSTETVTAELSSTSETTEPPNPKMSAGTSLTEQFTTPYKLLNSPTSARVFLGQPHPFFSKFYRKDECTSTF